jgi:hypothetical protein
VRIKKRLMGSGALTVLAAEVGGVELVRQERLAAGWAGLAGGGGDPKAAAFNNGH